MSDDSNVVNIKNALKAKQLVACFDENLKRLAQQGADPNEAEESTIELLSEWLEEAIENGMQIEDLHSRANALAQYAFSRGYLQHEVEELLTMRPNPNGKRPK